MGFRILGQKWAGRAKSAKTKQVQDKKETTNARRLSKRANKKVADENTKSIHDNKTTEDKVILMRQLSKGKVPNRQTQKTKWRSVTCNRVSGKTKRVQRTTQVVQETQKATTYAYSIRMHMEFLIQLQIASSTCRFRKISCPRCSTQQRSSS